MAAFSAGEHATALAQLLTDAGQTAALAEDFEFAWPDGDVRRPGSRSRRSGSKVTPPLLGVVPEAAAARSRSRRTAPCSRAEPRTSPSRSARCPAVRRPHRRRVVPGPPSTSRPRATPSRPTSARREPMRRDATILIAAILALGRSLSGRGGRAHDGGADTIYAAASLTEVFKAYDADRAVQLRRLERARDADQARERPPTSSPPRPRSTPSGSSRPASSTSRSRSRRTGSR